MVSVGNQTLRTADALFLSCSMLSPNERVINGHALKAYKDMQVKAKISNNVIWTERLNRVAPRIAKASGEDFNWDWILIESPEVNAWGMPGGKIAVYTGIKPVLKTEAAPLWDRMDEVGGDGDLLAGRW